MQGVEAPQGKTPDPTEDAVKMVARLNEAKQTLMENMKEFNKILNNNVLSENKSVKENEQEQLVINNLVKSALVVDNLNNGEGLLALCVLSIRQGLSLRDAGNRLAYQIDQLKKEIKQLKDSSPENKPSPEDLLKAHAKELGIKIKVESEG